MLLPCSALVCLVDGPDDEDVEDDHDAARHDPHEHEVGQQDVILQGGKEDEKEPLTSLLVCADSILIIAPMQGTAILLQCVKIHQNFKIAPGRQDARTNEIASLPETRLRNCQRCLTINNVCSMSMSGRKWSVSSRPHSRWRQTALGLAREKMGM